MIGGDRQAKNGCCNVPAKGCPARVDMLEHHPCCWPGHCRAASKAKVWQLCKQTYNISMFGDFFFCFFFFVNCGEGPSLGGHAAVRDNAPRAVAWSAESSLRALHDQVNMQLE